MLLHKLQLGSLGEPGCRPSNRSYIPRVATLPQRQCRTVLCEAKRGRKKASEQNDPNGYNSEDVLTDAELTQRALEEAARDREAQLAASNQVSDEDAVNENSPKRYPYHKRLLAYAQQGSVEEAEGVLREMDRAGLKPGPRAYHALLFAAIKSGDVDGALAVAQEAASNGLELLPESFKALMFAFINQEEPDVDAALGVYESMQEQVEDIQDGWLLLVKQLFLKGLDDDAMALVAEGREQGLKPDSDLCEPIIRNLCAAGLKEQAYMQLDLMGQDGIDLLPAHYNWLIRQEAMGGHCERAEALLSGFFEDPRAVRPDVSSFNALLEGLVTSLNPESSEDSRQYMLFKNLRDAMFTRGLRPNRYTHKHVCRGYIRMRDADLALAAFTSMREASGAGGSRLLDRQYLACLLILLSLENRPVDLLNTLNDMVADMCYIPGAALAPNSEGLSIIGEWVPAHYDVMKARAAGQYAEEEDLEEDRLGGIRLVDGERVGPGDCVVDDDGVIIAPNRLSVVQVQVEGTLRGLNLSLKTREIKSLIREARERLPASVKDYYKSAREAKRRRDEVESGVKSTAKERVETRHGYYSKFEFGKLLETGPIVRTFRAGTQERTVGGADEELAELELPTGDDDLELTLTGGVEEGVKDIIEGEDPDTWLDTPGEEEEGEEGLLNALAEREAEDEPVVDHFDARKLNKVAGMTIAIDVLKAVEMLGGQATHNDLLALVKGARAEASSAACVELAQRGKLLQQAGVEAQTVADVYADLMLACLDKREFLDAERVLQQADALSIQLDDSAMALFNQTTGGRRLGALDAASEAVEGVAETPADVEGDEEWVVDSDEERAKAGAGGARTTAFDEVVPEARELVWDVAVAEAAERLAEDGEEGEEEAEGFRSSAAAPGARPAGQQFQSALQRHVDVLIGTVGEQALAALGPDFLEALAERTMVLDNELSELYVAAQNEAFPDEEVIEEEMGEYGDEAGEEGEGAAAGEGEEGEGEEGEGEEPLLTAQEQQGAALLQARLKELAERMEQNGGQLPDDYSVDALLEGVFPEGSGEGQQLDFFAGNVAEEAMEGFERDLREFAEACGVDVDAEEPQVAPGAEPPEELVQWLSQWGDAEDDDEGVWPDEEEEDEQDWEEGAAAAGAR